MYTVIPVPLAYPSSKLVLSSSSSFFLTIYLACGITTWFYLSTHPDGFSVCAVVICISNRDRLTLALLVAPLAGSQLFVHGIQVIFPSWVVVDI